MKYLVRISNSANSDLNEIYQYISDNLTSPLTAKQQIFRIINSIEQLSSFPKRYPVLDRKIEFELPIHLMPIDNFSILYTISNAANVVTVIGVYYHKKDLTSLDF